MTILYPGFDCNCTGCEREWRCFLRNDKIKFRGGNFKAITGRDEATYTKKEFIEAFDGENFVDRCMRVEVCPRSCISEQAVHWFNVYQSCGGTSRIATPDEYYDLSALYIDVCAIIETERSRVEAIKRQIETARRGR